MGQKIHARSLIKLAAQLHAEVSPVAIPMEYGTVYCPVAGPLPQALTY